MQWKTISVKKIIGFLLGLPKTIYFNFRTLPLKKAILFPIYVGYNTRFGKLNKRIDIHAPIVPFMIKFNWAGTPSRTSSKVFFSIGKDAELILNGKAHFSAGTSLCIDRGKMNVGKNFFCNRNCAISCNDTLLIGDNVMLGWNIEILDSDNHQISYGGVEKESTGPIIIADHVWIAAYVHILKNSTVPKGSIVAYKSVLRKQYTEENALYGGNPAKLIHREVEWESHTVGE